jgi:PAS domain S-box-containing protein
MAEASREIATSAIKKEQGGDKALFEHLFESLQEAIVLLDNQGTVLKINREFQSLFGYTDDDAVGRNIDDLVAPPGLEDQARQVTTSVVSGERQALETRRRRKDGSLVGP